MGEADWFRKVTLQRRPTDQLGGVGPGAADRGDEEPPSGVRVPEEPVGGEELVPAGGVPGEPLPERGKDPRKRRPTGRHGHDGEAEGAREGVEVDHVESPHDGPVQKYGARARPAREAPDERGQVAGRAGAVDRDPAESEGLDPRGDREGDRRDRRPPVSPPERSVVDPDHVEVGFRERPPQR